MTSQNQRRTVRAARSAPSNGKQDRPGRRTHQEATALRQRKHPAREWPSCNEDSAGHWIRYGIPYHRKRHPQQMGIEVEASLTHQLVA